MEHFNREQIVEEESLAKYLVTAARKYSKNIALVTGFGELSYEKLMLLCLAFCKTLNFSGLGSQSRIGILVPTSWQFVIAACGSSFAGAVFVPLDPEIGSDTFEHILKSCPLDALVIDKRFLSRFERLNLPEVFLVCDYTTGYDQLSEGGSFEKSLAANLSEASSLQDSAAEDLCSINFTSGSTGIPKGVMQSNRSWLYGSLGTAEYFELKAGNNMVIGLPLAHTYALRHLFAYLISGATLILASDFFSSIKLLMSDNMNVRLASPCCTTPKISSAGF